MSCESPCRVLPRWEYLDGSASMGAALRLSHIAVTHNSGKAEHACIYAVYTHPQPTTTTTITAITTTIILAITTNSVHCMGSSRVKEISGGIMEQREEEEGGEGEGLDSGKRLHANVYIHTYYMHGVIFHFCFFVYAYGGT